MMSRPVTIPIGLPFAILWPTGKKGGAVGVARVACSSGRDSNYSAGFLGDVLEGGEARGCRFESYEGAPVYQEVFRCARAYGYHQSKL